MALPAGSRSPADVSYLDAGNEIGTTRFYGLTLTAANFDAQAALWATLLSAMDAVTLGVRVRDQYNDETTYVGAQPVNGAAREIKLLVQLINDVTGRKFGFSIPTLDPTVPDYVINVNAKDAIQVDAPAAIAALVTAIEAFCVDPLAEANAVSVIGLKVVGRNS
jgi:hypothetical protein